MKRAHGMIQVNKVAIGLVATAIAAGAVHEGTPPRPCTNEESCPEPEQPMNDMKEHGRPGPIGPARIANVTRGPTGPGSGAILSGQDIVAGTGFISVAGSDADLTVQPRIIPSV